MRATSEVVLLDERTAHHLERVAPEVFDHAIRPESLAAFLADPRHVLYLAVDDGTVVGMASGVETFHPDKAPSLFVAEVGVAPSHQRQGLGRRLTEAVIAWGRERGCDSAWVATEPGNVAARALYGSIPGASEAETFVMYEWDIDPSSERDG